ncbi:hypothetical protein [Micromonospora sp. NPDC005324]|uniref:WD40/YVTN/BNR-like repeat-containing protein n=1 Tax=Micromonospora sp. NPDC005324 TaxID=3157033 RepID=UPI0033B3AEC0
MRNREFSGFDIDTVTDAVRQPPLGDLRNAARSRRQRRMVGMGLAVVLALAGAGTTFLPTGDSSQGLQVAGPDPTRPATQARTSILVVLSDRTAVAVEEAEGGCKISFAATTDAGRSWSDWQSARYNGTCTTTVDAKGLGATDVRYSVLSERSYLVRFDDQWVLTTDTGRTWQSANTAITAVPAFPKNAQPVTCQQGCGAITQPLAVDPASGRVFRLTGQPPSPYPPYSIYESPDGAIWNTYWPGDGQPAVVARSADRGATWRTSRAPEKTTAIGVAAVSAQEAYLLTEPLPAGPNGTPASGPSRLLRTTNGGQSWEDVGTDLPTSDAVRLFTIGSNGSLMLLDTEALTGYVMMSQDGGRHFTKGKEQHGVGGVGANPGRAWLYGRDDQSIDGADQVQLTTDGSTWTRLPLPD